MKKTILAVTIFLFVIIILVFVLQHPNKSYISFERDCIEVKAPIEEVADKTIREFPECIIKSRGKLFNSDFIYGKCGTSALRMSEFMITADKQDCEVYSSMGPVQKRTIVMKQNLVK